MGEGRMSRINNVVLEITVNFRGCVFFYGCQCPEYRDAKKEKSCFDFLCEFASYEQRNGRKVCRFYDRKFQACDNPDAKLEKLKKSLDADYRAAIAKEIAHITQI